MSVVSRRRISLSRRLRVEPLECRIVPATVAVNATSNVHAIDPNIYGTAFATTAQLSDLNIPINRNGGNASDTYSYQQDATNHGSDWYFESIASGSGNGQGMDSWISSTKGGGAQASVTLNLFDWAAKLGANRSILGSFSTQTYQGQQYVDPYNSLWGNGVYANGSNVTNNDPNVAYTPNSPTIERAWIQHLVSVFGDSQHGGVGYYTLGNEPGIWYATHRDIAPVGETLTDLRDRIIAYSSMVKSVDPNAKILGPEEWGWSNYFISGFDGQAENWSATYDGLAAQPWLLNQLHQHDVAAGQRSLDYFTLHFYPQAGEFSDDVSTATELLRNRSTRGLWDPNYVDESWIGQTGINGGHTNLINLMKNWVNTYYPGLKTGITEYNWGAEGNMNGATTQADIWGIFGREGLDLANRWTTPNTGSAAYLAMKMYRNYDSAGHAFGNTSVAATVANPDQVSAFASTRSADGSLTIMVINKNLYDPANPNATTPISVSLSNFAAGGPAQVWQLAAVNASNQNNAALTRRSDIQFSGGNFTLNVPMESVTLFVIPPAATTPAPTISGTSVNAGAAQRSRVTSLQVTFSTQVTFAGASNAAFTLTRAGDGATVQFVATPTVVNGVTVVSFSSFTGTATEFGSLADGRYTLTALAGQISAGGRSLDGNGDGTAGDNYTFTDAQGLFRLYGDVNGDKAVDGLDLTAFRNAFGSVSGNASYVPFLDFNGDGAIDGSDLTAFRNRFGAILP
jgi:hypothetical protein